MTVVERPIALHLGSTHMVPAVLRYDPASPFEVVLSSARPDGAVIPWRFARSLLAEGMQASGLRMAGVDAVVLYRVGQRLYLRLRDRAGVAEVWASAPAVGAFLAASYRLVPLGTEVVDFDAELAALIASGGAR